MEREKAAGGREEKADEERRGGKSLAIEVLQVASRESKAGKGEV